MMKLEIENPLWSARNYYPWSLLAQVEEEIRSKGTTWHRIASLILKFYHLCVTKEDPANEVSYDTLTSIYHESQLLLLARRTIKRGNNSSLPLETALTIIRDYPRFWNHIQYTGNELRMIGDIPATTLIFRDIIERVLKPEGSGFIGLDLGTWTGILLLALFVVAHKCGDPTPKLYWFSDNEMWVPHTRDIVWKLGLGAEVFEADTTASDTYKNHVWGSGITMVCNENIPHHSERIHAEPFFHNLRTLSSSQVRCTPQTQFFPSRVIVGLPGWTKRICDSNEFFIDAPEIEPESRYSDIEVWWRLLPLRDFHLEAANIVWIPPCHPGLVRW